MSTLAELFDAIPAQAWQQCRAHPQPADPATDVATDAAAALAHAARLLKAHIGGTPLGRGRYPPRGRGPRPRWQRLAGLQLKRWLPGSGHPGGSAS